MKAVKSLLTFSSLNLMLGLSIAQAQNLKKNPLIFLNIEDGYTVLSSNFAVDREALKEASLVHAATIRDLQTISQEDEILKLAADAVSASRKLSSTHRYTQVGLILNFNKDSTLRLETIGIRDSDGHAPRIYGTEKPLSFDQEKVFLPVCKQDFESISPSNPEMRKSIKETLTQLIENTNRVAWLENSKSPRARVGYVNSSQSRKINGQYIPRKYNQIGSDEPENLSTVIAQLQDDTQVFDVYRAALNNSKIKDWVKQKMDSYVTVYRDIVVSLHFVGHRDDKGSLHASLILEAAALYAGDGALDEDTVVEQSTNDFGQGMTPEEMVIKVWSLLSELEPILDGKYRQLKTEKDEKEQKQKAIQQLKDSFDGISKASHSRSDRS